MIFLPRILANVMNVEGAAFTLAWLRRGARIGKLTTTLIFPSTGIRLCRQRWWRDRRLRWQWLQRWQKWQRRLRWWCWQLRRGLCGRGFCRFPPPLGRIFCSFLRRRLWRITLAPPCPHPCARISHRMVLCSVWVKMRRCWGEIARNCWREKFFYVGLVLRGVAF